MLSHKYFKTGCPARVSIVFGGVRVLLVYSVTVIRRDQCHSTETPQFKAPYSMKAPAVPIDSTLVPSTS